MTFNNSIYFLLKLNDMQNNISGSNHENTHSYYKKWMIFAPIGLLLIGAGMCVFGTAFTKMQHNAGFMEWFLWGTASLVMINGGLCFFGSAIKYSILHELARKRGET
jgi:hypothetical protein